MAISFNGLISDRNVRWALTSMLILLTTGVLTFLILRLRTVDELQTENGRLKAEVVDLRRQIEVQAVATQQRITALEATIFGTLVPEIASAPEVKPAVVLSAPAQWQITRDRELRQRILALEQWRLQQEQERE